jgi:hypothetical protein
MASNHGADYYLLKGNSVCNTFKWGEYNGLRCCRQLGHEGEHNYVVAKKVRETTEAMRIQHKLFTDLGTLHRARANLRDILGQCTNTYYHDSIENAIVVITKLIEANSVKMKNIPKTQHKSNSTV